MRCPSCDTDNPDSSRFCNNCGTALKALCPQCRAENPPKAKYCGECGARLTVPDSPAVLPVQTPTTPTPEAVLPAAERRQLTVMFADLVGSTPLAEQLDPEDFRQLLHDYQAACARVIGRFDGYIAKYMGDGILVYFGYPVAHEDDARRAAQAGLGMLEAVERLNDGFQQRFGVRVRLRIGVHTGLVVAGDMGEGAQFEARAIVGQTPNIAARLQSIAEPDTLVISEATHRLLRGYFHCEPLGVPELKGVSHRIPVYRVLYESTARNRLEAVGYRGLTPLVGRKAETAQLVAAWERAKQGGGYVITISGEAGIGKSRLVYALKELVANADDGWLTELRCSVFHQNSALHPVIDLLEQVVLGFERGDSSEERLRKLEGFLTQLGVALDEAVPLMAPLLSLPVPPAYPPLGLTPLRQKQKTFEMLVGFVEARARYKPVLFVVDDLQWADPTTRELIELLLTRLPSQPILAVLMFRPEFLLETATSAPIESIALRRLPPEETADLISGVSRGKGLPPEVLRQVAQKTDGIPLYVEEFTRMLLESGQLVEREDRYELTEALPAVAVPTSLQDSLMARLDRLDEGKTVAQMGATLGREFRYDLLRAVSPVAEVVLQRNLTQLVGAELLYQQGTLPNATFQFKHALIQDAAYESLLKATRQQYHERTARALVEQFPEDALATPETVAHHFTGAGLAGDAIPYWQQAGQRALQSSANLEAIAHLGRGLTLLESLPESLERTQQELHLRLLYGSALIATRGFADPEAGQVFHRAREICLLFGDAPQLFQVLWGLYTFYVLRAELDTCHDLAEQLLRLAEQGMRSEFLVGAHAALAASHWFQGRFAEGLRHSRQSLDLYNREEHGPLAYLFGQDSGVVAAFYFALPQWHLGYPDSARDAVLQAVSLAEQVGFTSSIAQAYGDASFIYILRREWAEAERWARSALDFSVEHAFPMWVAYSMMFLGFAQAKAGRREQGIAQLRQGLALWEGAGARTSSCYFNVMVAEVCGDTGEIEEGLAVLAKAEGLIEATGERWPTAALLRTRGELLLKQAAPDVAGAEQAFLQSLEVARSMGARLPEFQTALRLAQIWHDNGRTADAIELLTPLHARFTEGFEMPDLIAARNWLEMLGAPVPEPQSAGEK